MMGRSPFAFAAACGLVASFAAPAFAQSDEPATLVQVRGSVRGAIAPATSWNDVGPGSRLRAGDTLKTPADASAEIVFPSGGRVAIAENAIIRLQDTGGLNARLMTGRARLTAPPEGTATLAAGNLRLVGTDADAVIEKAGSAWRVAVLAGSFSVSEAGRGAVTVEAGRAGIFAAGQEPRYNVISRAQAEDLVLGFGQDMSSSLPPVVAAPRMATGAPEPWVAAALSALLPGAGQVYASEVPRGLLYLGAEFALLGTGAYGVLYGQRQMAMLAGAGLIGLNVISPLDAWFTTPERVARSGGMVGLAKLDIGLQSLESRYDERLNTPTLETQLSNSLRSDAP